MVYVLIDNEHDDFYDDGVKTWIYGVFDNLPEVERKCNELKAAIKLDDAEANHDVYFTAFELNRPTEAFKIAIEHEE